MRGTRDLATWRGGRPRGHRTPDQWARVRPTWAIRTRLLQLRQAGCSYALLGRLLGVTRQRAHQLVQRAKRDQSA